jgi:hypothetical protein
MSDNGTTSKSQAAQHKAAKRLDKHAETLTEEMEELSGKEAMQQAQKQSLEQRQAFLGYGCLDIFKYKWLQGPNKREVNSRERDRLADSFVKHGRKWWEPENMIPVVLARDLLDLSTVTKDTPDPAKPVRFNENDDDMELLYLGGGHRMAALKKLRDSMQVKLDDAELVIRDEKISDERRKALELEISGYQSSLPSLGFWGIRFYDAGKFSIGFQSIIDPAR